MSRIERCVPCECVCLGVRGRKRADWAVCARGAPANLSDRSDHSAELSDVRNVLEELMGVPKTTHEDRMITKRVCELVGLRAARLAAAGIAGVVCSLTTQPHQPRASFHV